MSKQSLVKFLQKLDAELSRGTATRSASDIWRTQTGNKLTTTITVSTTTITKTIKAAVSSATNVPANGDILIKDLGSKYTDLTKALIQKVKNNFEALAASKKGITILTKRPRTTIRVKIDQIEGSRRDNFNLGQKQYKDALQDFYEDFSALVGEYLSQVSSTNKTGKIDQTKQSQIFNLEHFKGKSNVQGFIDDKIYNAIQSYDGSLEDLKANAEALGLTTFLNIEKSAKTGEVKVYVGSQFKNVQESAGERKIKTDLQKALREALEKLKEPLFELKGSDSLKDAKKKKLLEKALKPFKKVKNATVKASSTKIEKSKTHAQLNVSGKIKQVNLAKSKLRKRNVRQKAQSSPAGSMLQMIGMINKELPDTVRKNMKSPALVNRTGRFAESTRVTDITQTPKGFPSIGYTYQRDPYQVFEDGSSGAWSNGQRDPRKLIDSSIREIAVKMAIGRFYTRRV